MGLNDRPASERVHIGFFGLRNAGKSSVVNRVTGQELSLVSDNKGTTTDPVKKTMELLPIGPVVIIDTPGIDDEGELGKMRVERAKDVLGETDIAVLVVDATSGLKGELLTYSDTLLKMYAEFIIDLYNRNENLAKLTIENTAKLQGYDSLRKAEESLK